MSYNCDFDFKFHNHNITMHQTRNYIRVSASVDHVHNHSKVNHVHYNYILTSLYQISWYRGDLFVRSEIWYTHLRRAWEAVAPRMLLSRTPWSETDDVLTDPRHGRVAPRHAAPHSQWVRNSMQTWKFSPWDWLLNIRNFEEPRSEWPMI